MTSSTPPYDAQLPCVELSDDHQTMTVRNDGTAVTLRSSRAGGFTEADIAPRNSRQPPRMMCGQVNRVWRFTTARRDLFMHVNTGPPTWWIPRVEMTSKRGDRTVMVGWLRGMVAVSITTRRRRTKRRTAQEQTPAPRLGRR